MSDYLPPEVVTLILSRLPVESAVKCTAVCKSWYALIKDPSFISTHLQQALLSLHHNDLLLLSFVRDGRVFCRLHRDDDATFGDYKQFRPLEFGFGFFVVGTCKGLICLAMDADPTWNNIILWNPSIHKHFTLPNPDLPYSKSHDSNLGFGFDSVSNDFKVLVFLHFRRRESVVIEVWLFSLNRLSWTRHREVMSPNESMFSPWDAVFAKGVLHCPALFWDSKKGHSSHMISAFDMSTERFYVMNFPETLANDMEYEMSLVQYEESIAVVRRRRRRRRRRNRYLDDRQFELWVMKEYGVSSSWTKVFHSIDENGAFVFGPDFIIDVFGVRKKGKVLLKVRREHEEGHNLATLDLNGQQLKHHVGIININFRDTFLGNFVESLVLLDIGKKDTMGAAV